MKGSESSSSAEGHVALVTGGSRGIGAAICRRLARAGAAVLVASRQLESCQELADEICAEGGRAWGLALDVGDPDSIAQAVQEAELMAGASGGVSWLVNNAGIAESASLAASIADPGIYERHLRINFHGPRRMLEALLPHMQKRGQGRVVNVASSAGLRGYGYVAAYCASKFALVGWTLSAAIELERSGLKINAVCPHYVDSPMLAASVARLVEKTGKSVDEARAFFERENPRGALVSPEQVAESVLELLLGEHNACLVELDGGPEPIHRFPNSRNSS